MQNDLLQRCAEFTAKWEGFRDNIYEDATGIPTFGFGSLVSHHPNIAFPVTRDIALQCLQSDLNRAYSSVRRLIKIPLPDNAIIALVDFVYNLGGGALQASTLRKRINRGERNVSREFLKWVYAGGRELSGLRSRRMAEARLYTQE
jgi:lysozyme